VKTNWMATELEDPKGDIHHAHLGETRHGGELTEIGMKSAVGALKYIEHGDTSGLDLVDVNKIQQKHHVKGTHWPVQ